MQVHSIQSTCCKPARLMNKQAFTGINFHIVDGGPHADNMEHFAKVIMKDLKKERLKELEIF